LGRHNCVVCALFVSTNVIAETNSWQACHCLPTKHANRFSSACLCHLHERMHSVLHTMPLLLFYWQSFFTVLYLWFYDALICAVSHVKARLSPSTSNDAHDAITLHINVARTNKSARDLGRSCSLIIGHIVNLAVTRPPGTTKAPAPASIVIDMDLDLG
jgi:hypothetical protein